MLSGSFEDQNKINISSECVLHGDVECVNIISSISAYLVPHIDGAGISLGSHRVTVWALIRLHLFR